MLVAALATAIALVAIRPTRGALALACVILCLPHFVGRAPHEAPALRLCEVGHGEAALVTLSDGRRVLFDCGANSTAGRAARAVLDVLDGPRCIDVAVLSHADADHVAGFAALLSRVRIREAVMPSSMRGAEVARQLERGGVALRVLEPGTTHTLFDGVTVHAPEVPPLAPSNEHSLWLRVDLGGLRVVLPADAEALGIAAALRDFDLSGTDVLVLPHHGRGLPHPNQRLLAATRPRLALISCGSDPPPPLAPLATAMGAFVIATHDAGTITVRLDGSRAVTTAREPAIGSSEALDSR